MARPDRYKIREAGGLVAPEAEGDGKRPAGQERRTQLVSPPPPPAAASLAPARAAEVVDPYASDLDDRDDRGQSSDQAGDAEGESPFDPVARSTGWTPRSEWRGRPENWCDSETWIKRQAEENRRLKDRLRRTGAVADQAAEEARRQQREQGLSEVRAAATAGDPDAAVAAAAKVASASGPKPQTAAWIARNTWFNEDPVAKAVAVAETNRLAAQGFSTEDQLEAAEAEVRKRFPEHFQAPIDRDERGGDRAERYQERGEVRLSELRTTEAPHSQGGNSARDRGQGRNRREPGWNEIPADEREHMERQVTKLSRRFGKTADEMRKQLAGNYWRNKAG
jgi:hypothetical protein